MNYEFKFIKGRANVEKLRVNVRDPIKGNSSIDPSSLSKIELIVGAVIISTATGEITWEDDVIQIKPSANKLLLLPKRAHSELVAYKDDEGTTIGQGIVVVADYG
jgi:hypothetical protein